MLTDLTIRTATEADVETLASFNEAMARETERKTLDPETVRAGVRALITGEQRGFYLLAERDGSVVGSLMITTEWSDWRNGDFWWIQSVYVRPEARREGIYTTMHDRVKAMASDDPSVCGIRLYVERGNAAAQATYQALGMQQTSYRLYEEMIAD